ncbi:hypothetical protein HGA34_05555 [Candidatus Falkowbacteria bacterium]|nr:hypothetical protein [Candidatus Falkowbacteria bacterium]
MKKFILFFRGGTPSPEKKDENMKEWNAWMTNLFKSGVIESGLPLTDEGVAVTEGGVRKFHEGSHDVSGYLIINVHSSEEAVEIAKSAPHIAMGGSTEVREAMPMSM